MTRTVQQLFDLEGKTALVTGGSRGLGLQLAHALGEAGARVVLSARKAGELEEAVADLQARASTRAGSPPTAPRKKTSASWPTRPSSAWATSTSW
jgi:NAD(P)-dependent dehydrogenase (short-subunit alcohol dehydrogenase family)